MHKRTKAPDPGVAPPSKVPYKVYECPAGCGREESAGKPPSYSECPSCHKPAGTFALKASKKGK